MTCRYGIFCAKRGCFKATRVICDFCCMMPSWRKIEREFRDDAMRKTQTRKRPEQEETRAETEPKTNTDGRHNDYAHPPVTLPRSERRFFLFSSSSINLWRRQPRPETYRGNKLGRKSFSFRAAKSSGVELPTGSRLIRPLRQSRKGTAQFGVEWIAPFLCVRARSVLETI